jgi:hypothetical protein
MAILINDASATGPLEQGIDYTISSDGPFWVRTWVGAASQIAVLVPTASINAESIYFRNQAPLAILTARYARHPLTGAESVQNKIEIRTEMITQSVFLAPAYIGIPNSVKKVIQTLFENATPAEDTGTGTVLVLGAYSQIIAACANAKPNSYTSDANKALAREVYDLMVGGTTHFEICTSSLTLTRIVSRYYSLKTARTDLDQVFSTAQVSGYIGDPVLFDVPSITVSDDETKLNLIPGWRKRLADINGVAGGSRTIVENWELAKWNKKLYPPAAGSGL